MNLNELAATRRSVRVYKEAELSEEESLKKIKEIVDFVRINSPSWKNSQTHRYYAAVSAEKIAQVRDALSLRNQEKVNNSIALVVTAFEKDVSGFTEGKPDNELGNCWGAYDLGLSDSLFILKARELGLDTLIMGLRDADQIKKIFCIPENQMVGAVISVGFRAAELNQPPRKPLEEIAHFE